MRRPLLTVLAALALLAIPACGGDDDSGGGGLGTSLSYLPADVTTVVVLSTDLKSAPFKEAGESVAPAFTGGEDPVDIEGLARRAVDSGSELSYDSEIEPLLGNPIVFGTSDPEGLASDGFGEEADLVVAFETDTGAVRDLLEQFGDSVEQVDEQDGAEIYSDESQSFWLALDGDIAVATVDRGDLLDALAQADRGDGFSESDFNNALEGLPRDAPLRAYADAERLREIPEVRSLEGLPWVDALQTAGASVTVQDGALAIDGVANTDPSALSEDDLPLAPGEATPEVVRQEGRISGASIDQSQTTAFLLDVVRSAFPDSDFARDVRKVERSLDIDFEREVLRQFDGPSASLLSIPSVEVQTFPPQPDTTEEEFAARSQVSNPKQLASVMRRLAPDLGRLIEDLQGLQSEGLAALFLVAPDAPIRPGVLPPGSIEVETVDGEPGFYRITGLAAGAPPGLPTPVPDDLVFGLVGDQFVVASSVADGKEIARAESVPAEDVEGASVIEAEIPDLAALEDELAGVAGQLSGSLQASLDELRGQLRIRFGQR